MDSTTETTDDSKTGNTSIEKILSSILFNGSVFLGLFLLFCFLRPRWKTLFSPRSRFTGRAGHSPALPPTFLTWLAPFYRISDADIINCLGLDAYIFLNFVRSCFLFFTGATAIAFLILLPLNTVDQKQNTRDSMQYITIRNIVDFRRLWAHAIVSCFFTMIVVYGVVRSLRVFMSLRHSYLTSERHRELAQARTLMISDIPESHRNPLAITRMFSSFGGGVAKVFMIKRMRELEKDVQERAKIITKIERAVTDHLKEANKNITVHDPDKLDENSNVLQPQGIEGCQTAARKPNFLFCLAGNRNAAESIQQHMQRYHELTSSIDKQRDKLYAEAQEGGIDYSAAFVTFRSQFDAHLAAQASPSTDPLAFRPNLLEVPPVDVVWENLNISPAVRFVRKVVAVAVATLTILFWTVLVGFVLSFASLSQLAVLLPFMEPVITWNANLVGLIEGVIPPVVVTILLGLVPVLLAYIAKMEGKSSMSEMVLTLHRKYFYFLIFQVLFVGTVVTGGIQAGSRIIKLGERLASSPLEIVQILADGIPAAGDFLFTYVALLAFIGMAKELIQFPNLIILIVKSRFIAHTPREIYEVKVPPAFKYATTYAQLSVVFTIGIVYSTITPVMLSICTIYFGVSYFAYRYGLCYVYRNDVETGGLHLTLVANHVFFALIIHQLTLIGILGLTTSTSTSSIGPMILTIITLVGTVWMRIYVHNSFSGVRTRYLPIDVAQAAEENRKLTDNVHGFEPRISLMPGWWNEKSCIGNDYVVPPTQPVLESLSRSPTSIALGSASPGVVPEMDHLSSLNCYYHPCLRSGPPIAWFPRDRKGLTAHKLREMQRAGILAGAENAVLDDGTVRILGVPPEILQTESALGLHSETGSDELRSQPASGNVDCIV